MSSPVRVIEVRTLTLVFLILSGPMFVPRDANLNVPVGAERAVATKHRHKSVNNNKVIAQIIGKKLFLYSLTKSGGLGQGV